MALSPGTWLNHYEVLAHLGTGGMGEVYRARDNKLQRDVALKVLPKAFAQDPERVARFRREAQVLAQVNHPNIAAIYSVEESGGTHFLVMELAQGETLKERIQKSGVRSQNRTGIPIDEALEIAKQIAAGLEAAHEKPIVHRDLKPANVKVTPEGVVKILDFGLARAFAGNTESGDPADSPTLSAMTAPGTILGTAAYMSPEQARGRRVDKRTDIWALGCVLYEMLAGKHAFEGEDVPEILASVMKGEPDWEALPQGTPRGIRRLLQRCLQKDPAKRFHSAADMAFEMEEALQEPSEAPPPPTVASPVPVVPAQPVWRRAMPSVITGLVVAVIVGGIAIWNRPAAEPQPVSQLVVPLPPGEQLGAPFAPMAALSPDGTQIAYVVRQNDIGSTGILRQIYLRTMDSLESKPLAGTGGAYNPFFSPDGQWIGFFANDDKLKKVSASGGATLTLADAFTPNGATWGPDDTIVFNRVYSEGLWQVSAAGGMPQQLTTLQEGETGHQWPQFLPDGSAVLFTADLGSGFYNGNISVIKMDTKEQKVLIQGGAFPRYAPTGHLLYYRGGTIMAAPFDAARLEVTGTPVPVFENVMPTFSPQTGGGQYSLSNTGSLIYIPGNPQAAAFTMTWVDRKGVETPLPGPARSYDDPRLSPDGRQVAVQIVEETNEIWTYDLARSTLTRLTFLGTANYPFWTPDGKRIIYRNDASGGQLLWKPADGSGAEEALLPGTGNQTVGIGTSISPDGKAVAYSQIAPDTRNDIWILPLEGDPSTGSGQEWKPHPFLQEQQNQMAAMFSPDGHWLAYVSDESGRNEIYVQPYPGPGGKWQISSDGGIQPVWSRNGRELFYRNGDKMMAVEIGTQPAFRAGTPQMLFEKPGLLGAQQGYPSADFDVSPDGQRFLMLKVREEQQTALSQINVVLNWHQELLERVPVD